MGITNWSDEIVLLDLSQEPEMLDELQCLSVILREKSYCKVLIDFSEVGEMTATGISKLLQVRKLADHWANRFALCNVPEAIKAMFNDAGHKRTVEVFDDRHLALISLDMVG